MFMSRSQREGQEGEIREGACYRPSNQDEEAEKVFYMQLTELVNESAREGIPLELLFVNGEGLVLGASLGRSNHNFDSWRTKEGSYQLPWISEGQPLASLEN